MGFLSRGKVPNELPDLAIEGSSEGSVEQKNLGSPTLPVAPEPLKSIAESPQARIETGKVAGEDYLEFNHPAKEIPPQLESKIPKEVLKLGDGESSFFDTVLEDINGEIKDLGKLEEWYNDKFLPQDVVSNMRTYWEENKADMIIKSFGSEYKEKINERIKSLQGLEEDWREIYFKLIKKEEEMKKKERELKETLSEFVDLCKRRRGVEEKSPVDWKSINGEKESKGEEASKQEEAKGEEEIK